MFYMLELQKTLDIAPRHFGKRLREHINDMLVREVCAWALQGLLRILQRSCWLIIPP
jgi:DNA-directed RNA polymerase subunit E'/Rpb7